MTVIGLVGPFGSGCSFIAKEILEKEFGYHYISLSDILREQYWKSENVEVGTPIQRSTMQDFGDAIREKNGSDYLSQMAVEKITAFSSSGEDKFVIDSIRNPEEVYFLKKTYVDFFVFGIFAGNNLRWERIQSTYSGNQAQFAADEKRDKGGEKVAYGQRVTDAFLTSEITDNPDFFKASLNP